MTITQLKYALALAEHQSFTLAAEHCKVSQPSLSMQIQKLEEELNAKLFNRSKKPLELTPIGEKVLRQAKVIVDESSRINDIVDQQKGYVGGDFILGVLPTIMPTLLPKFLDLFNRNYPNVRLKIEELTTDEIIRKLIDGHIDVAIASTPLQNEAIKERVLYYEPFVYVSNQRIEGHVTLDKVELNNMILIKNDAFRNSIFNFFGATRSKNIDLSTNDFQTLITLAKNDQGVTLIPYLQSLYLGEGDKALLHEFEAPLPSREVSLLYHKSQLKMQMIEALKKTIDTSVRGLVPFTEVEIVSPLSKN